MVKVTGKGLRFTSGEHVITARDSLEYWRAKLLAVARRGQSRPRPAELTRRSGLTAHFRETEGAMYHALVEATGGVIIQTRLIQSPAAAGACITRQRKRPSSAAMWRHHAGPKSIEWRARRSRLQNRRQPHARRRRLSASKVC